MRINTFSKGICSNVNAIVWLEFELTRMFSTIITTPCGLSLYYFLILHSDSWIYIQRERRERERERERGRLFLIQRVYSDSLFTVMNCWRSLGSSVFWVFQHQFPSPGLLSLALFTCCFFSGFSDRPYASLSLCFARYSKPSQGFTEKAICKFPTAHFSWLTISPLTLLRHSSTSSSYLARFLFRTSAIFWAQSTVSSNKITCRGESEKMNE